MSEAERHTKIFEACPIYGHSAATMDDYRVIRIGRPQKAIPTGRWLRGLVASVKRWRRLMEEATAERGLFLHFVVIAAGSDGDIFPLAALGTRLRARGHRVTFLAPINYENLATKAGMSFAPLSDSVACQQAVNDVPILSTRYHLLFALRHTVDWNRVVYDRVRKLMTPNLIVISVHRGMLWADFALHFNLRVPVIRLQLEPPIVSGVPGEIAGLPEGYIQRRLERRIDIKWREAMREVSSSASFGRVQKLKEVGCRTVPGICLYPRWLLGKRHSAVMKHFQFLPQPEMASALSEFPFDLPLRRRLIVFVAGTAGATGPWSDHFFCVSQAICRQVDCNGLLLGGEPPSRHSVDSVVWRQFVPLNQALPYASVIVHHGGIGTAAMALDYGMPQLIIPRFPTQPSNAEWLRRLGVCLVIEPKDYTVKRGVTSIQRLLSDNSFRQAGAMYAHRCFSKKNTAKLCRYLERCSIQLTRESHRRIRRAGGGFNNPSTQE